MTKKLQSIMGDFQRCLTKKNSISFWGTEEGDKGEVNEMLNSSLIINTCTPEMKESK